MDCSTPNSPALHYLSEIAQIHVHWVSDANCLILCRPLLLLPSVFLSVRVFFNDLALHIRWPKYWSLSFSIIPSNEYSGLISSRMDWLDILAVQGTLKGLLQHHSSKASVLRCSAFFMVQHSNPCLTIGKKHSLDIYQQSDVLFNMLARFIIAFLPRSSHLLISWPQLPSTVIWEPKKIKSVTASSLSPTICHELMGLDAMTLIFLMLNFKPAFSFSSVTLINRLFSSSSTFCH